MANYFESFSLLVLIVLLGFGNTPTFVETVDVVFWPLFYIPVFAETTAIAAFVGFILWYITRNFFFSESWIICFRTHVVYTSIYMYTILAVYTRQ